ncbi:MAG: DUF1799 domain-containing protein [Pseudomonadota bacterium]
MPLRSGGADPGLLRGSDRDAPGKLRAFGRAWARSELKGGIHDEAARDAERFGLEPPRAPEGFGLWAGHVHAARAFLAVDTQWRVAGGGFGMAVIGLDYTAVRIGLRAQGIRLDPDGWQDLRQIEAGAVEAMNEARS